jgi:hypothetical protein
MFVATGGNPETTASVAKAEEQDAKQAEMDQDIERVREVSSSFSCSAVVFVVVVLEHDHYETS